MLYLVVYDISADRLRTRLAKVLEAFGARVQGSVFEVRMPEAKVEELRSALSAVVREGTAGEVRVYPVCVRCYNDAFALGDIENNTGDGGFVIV